METNSVPEWVAWTFAALGTAAASAFGAYQWLLNRKDTREREKREAEEVKRGKAARERNSQRKEEDARRQEHRKIEEAKRAQQMKEKRERDEWLLNKSKLLVDDLQAQVGTLLDRVDEMHNERLECRVALARMTERVERLEEELARLRGDSA
jgi:hypothetical protein